MSGCTFDYHKAGIGEEGEKCIHPIWQGDSEFCLYHSHSPQKQNAFNSGISHFPRQGNFLDFRGFVFITSSLNHLLYYNQNIEINLKGSVFKSTCILGQGLTIPKINFCNSVFEGKTSFQNIHINNYSFKGSKFEDDATFSNMHGVDVDFSNCEFAGMFILENPYFNSPNFENSIFSSSARFLASSMMKPNFEKCSFFGETEFVSNLLAQSNFSGSTFHNSSSFKNNFSNSNFSNCTFNENAELTSGKINRADFSSTNLNNSNFSGATFFSYVSLNSCPLEGANFSQSEFQKGVNFSASVFDLDTLFKETQFAGDIDFEGTKFNQNNLEKLAFQGPVNFKGAQISRCSFNGSKFQGDVNLQVSWLMGTTFKKVNFVGEVICGGIFQNIDFSNSSFGNVSFNDVSTRVVETDAGKLTLKGSRFRKETNATFHQCELGETDFSDCIFQEAVSFDHSEFIWKTNFNNCKFNGGISAIKTAWRKPLDLSNRKFKKAVFIEAVFGSSVDFSNCELINPLFTGTEFGEGPEPEVASTNFKNTEFHDGDFSTSTFLAKATFEGAQFYGIDSQKDSVFFEEVSFNQVDFNTSVFNCITSFFKSKASNAVFCNSTFLQGETFEDAEFTTADFSNCKFSVSVFENFRGISAFFTGAEFLAKSNFNNAKLEEEIVMKGGKFFKKSEFKGFQSPVSVFEDIVFYEDCIFEGASLGELIFSDNTIKSSLDFSGVNVTDTEFRRTEIHGKANFQNFICSGSSFNFFGSVFFGEFNLSGARFFVGNPNLGELELDEVNFKGKTTFKKITCNGSFLATKLEVEQPFNWDSTVEGKWILHQAKFFQDCTFINQTFKDTFSLDGAKFAQSLSFKGSHFQKFSADQAKFQNHVDFSDCVFENTCILTSSRFEANLAFIRTNFLKELIFQEITVSEYLILHNITLSQSLSATNLRLIGLSYLTHHGDFTILFNQLQSLPFAERYTFQDQDCSKLAFVNSDLSRADFLGADIRFTRFDSCSWDTEHKKPKYPRLQGHGEIVEEVKEKSKESAYGPDARKKLDLLQSLYLQLIKRYEDERDYQQAGAFHYWEMELRLLKQQYFPEGKNTLGVKFENGLLHIYRWIGDHGENYLKLLGVFFLSQVVASILVLGAESSVGDSIADFLKSWLVNETDHWWFNLGSGIGYFLQTIQLSFSTILPAGLTKNIPLSKLRFTSKIILGFGAIGSFAFLSLFILSIRRRFRR